MRGRIWLVCMALALVMASCLPAIAQRPIPQTRPWPETEWKPKPVTLDLKGVPLNKAIEQIIAATDLSVIRVGEIPAEPRVTMILLESNPIHVLALLSRAGGIDFDEVGRAPTSEPVVVLLAARDIAGPWPWQGPQPTRGPEGAAAPAQTMPVEIHLAIDLNVEDVPFRNAVAQITAQIPDTEQVRIVVDDSVPNDIRVTARVHKMRLSWVLDNLVGQADLTYGLQDQVDPKVAEAWRMRAEEGLTDYLSMNEGMAKAPRLRTIHIVPKPELKVSASDKR